MKQRDQRVSVSQENERQKEYIYSSRFARWRFVLVLLSGSLRTFLKTFISRSMRVDWLQHIFRFFASCDPDVAALVVSPFISSIADSSLRIRVSRVPPSPRWAVYHRFSFVQVSWDVRSTLGTGCSSFELSIYWCAMIIIV